jgi:hypothetical protein
MHDPSFFRVAGLIVYQTRLVPTLCFWFEGGSPCLPEQLMKLNRHIGILASALLVGFSGSVAAQSHPWQMRYANAARTGQSTATGAQLGQLAWKYRTAGEVPNFAVASSGEILLGTTYNSNWWSQEMFVATIKGDGAASWRKKVTPYEWGFGQGVKAGPAIDNAGNWIVPSSNSQILKFDSNANLLWTFQENNISVNSSSPAVLPDGSIRHIQFGTVRAISSNGAEMFVRGGGGNGGSIAVAANGDMAAVADRSVEPHTSISMWYFNPDGSWRWYKTALRGGNGSTPLFGPDGKMYIWNACLNPADGNPIWTGTHGALTPALGKNGQFYTVSGFTIRAQNKDTGAMLWEINLNANVIEGLAIGADDVIYATTAAGDLAAINPDGSLTWKIHLCDKFKTGPVIGPNGLCLAAGQIGPGFGDWVFAVQ